MSTGWRLRKPTPGQRSELRFPPRATTEKTVSQRRLWHVRMLFWLFLCWVLRAIGLRRKIVIFGLDNAGKSHLVQALLTGKMPSSPLSPHAGRSEEHSVVVGSRLLDLLVFGCPRPFALSSSVTLQTLPTPMRDVAAEAHGAILVIDGAPAAARPL